MSSWCAWLLGEDSCSGMLEDFLPIRYESISLVVEVLGRLTSWHFPGPCTILEDFLSIRYESISLVVEAGRCRLYCANSAEPGTVSCGVSVSALCACLLVAFEQFSNPLSWSWLVWYGGGYCG